MDCLFCKITSDLTNSKVIYEDDILAVIMDINPVCDGHLLIIPKEHFTTVFDVPSNIMEHMYKVAQKMTELLMEKLGYKGVSIVFNYGDKQFIKHVHMHIIPDLNKKSTKTVDEIHKILIG